jgi:hypothetical protein
LRMILPLLRAQRYSNRSSAATLPVTGVPCRTGNGREKIAVWLGIIGDKLF